MDKKKVDALIPMAVDVLKDVGIANDNNEINRAFRGQISTFGAAIINGSLISAVAFFSNDSESVKVKRSKLMDAIYMLIKNNKDNIEKNALFSYVKDTTEPEMDKREKIINAAIALKLAMNIYKLSGNEDENE